MDSGDSVDAYVGLGSNLAGPRRQVNSGLRGLAALDRSRLVRCSSLYGSPPMGGLPQPDYVNAVAHIVTRLEAGELLERLRALEHAHGRVRGEERWAARTLDLDLLLYGDARIHTAALQVPHPGLAERDFVLVPLREVAPALVVPGMGPVEALARSCPGLGLRRIGPADLGEHAGARSAEPGGSAGRRDPATGDGAAHQ